MSEKWLRSVSDIVETLINGREHNRTCSLLIGAGCSVSAGIPLAADFGDPFSAPFDGRQLGRHRNLRVDRGILLELTAQVQQGLSQVAGELPRPQVEDVAADIADHVVELVD